MLFIGGFAAQGLVSIAHADIQGPPQRKSSDLKPGDSAKERIKRAIAIPTPKDVSVKVFRGNATQIVLEATNASRQPTEFRLGDQPKHGTLTTPGPSDNSKDQAFVTYTAAADSTAEHDQFTFRVKCRDTPTSGSALVKIEIVDQKPVLKVESRIDFGEVPVGETAVRTVEFKNVGTGPLTAPMVVPLPWRLLDEKTMIELEQGGQDAARVSYMPAGPGEHKHDIVFDGIEGGKMTLVGKAVPPFEVRPSWVKLEWMPEDKSRRGSFAVVNRSLTNLSFTVESPARLKMNPATAEVAPDQSIDLQVTIPAEDGEEFHAPLSVLSRACRIAVPVSADASPAWLRVEEIKGNKAPDGAVLVPADGDPLTVLVKNAGGTAAPLFINPPAGFELLGFNPGRDLKPGEVVAFAVRAPPARGSPPEGEASLELGDAKLPLFFRAKKNIVSTIAGTNTSDTLLNAPPSNSRTVSADKTASIDPSAGTMSEKEAQLRLMTDVVGVFPSTVEFDRTLPEVDAVRVKAMSPTTFTLAWKPVGPEYDYVLFRQEYKPLPGDTMPTRRWLPWDGLKVKKSASEVETTLKKLRPGHRYSLRLAVKAPDGKLGQASPPFVAITPSSRPGLWWKVSLVALLVASAGWFAWRKWQQRYEED